MRHTKTSSEVVFHHERDFSGVVIIEVGNDKVTDANGRVFVEVDGRDLKSAILPYFIEAFTNKFKDIINAIRTI